MPFRALWQLIRESRSGDKKPTTEEQEAVERAFGEADKAAKVAEAQIAKALGYQLCRCQFPPVAMLTVGHMMVRGAKAGHEVKPVHECPACGYCDAGSYNYTRIAPPREVKQDTPPSPAPSS